MRACKALLATAAFLCIAFLCNAYAQSGGTTYTITAGSSSATIQSTINTAASGSGNVVQFQAGTYTINPQITIPCSTNLTIQGPAVAWPGPYTATMVSGVGSNWMFSYNGCSGGLTVQNLNFNGNRPSPDGGGALYFGQSGGSNVSILNNNFYGNQGNTTKTDQFQDTLVYFDGFVPNSNTWSNVTISGNNFGTSGDCSNLMNVWYYQGDYYGNVGGQCAGVGVHTSTTNMLIQNNNFEYQEEGLKFYVAGPQGGAAANQWFQTNQVTQYNDFGFIHRIEIEAQATPNPVQTFNYNSGHDQVAPCFGSFGFSLPQYAQIAGNLATNASYNLQIANVAASCGGPNNYIPSAMEFWGTGVENNNVIQGLWAAGIDWGYGASPWAANNNLICGANMAASNSYINKEESSTSASNAPSQSGNTTSSTCSALTSTAPTISPAGGTVSGSVTVTLSNAGVNTSTWYTTDGSTPVPGQGTAKIYTAPFTVSSTTTVKAVGMWGAYNQPKSYPSGYGYVPSGVQTATYTTGGTRTVTKVTLSTANGATALPVGATNQASAVCTYSDGTTDNCVVSSHTVTWASSTTATATINSSGLVTAVANGTTNLTATAASITSANVPLTVSTLSSIAISSAAGTVLHPGGGGGLVRGRVLVQGGSVVADDGQPLRFVTARLRSSEWGPVRFAAILVAADARRWQV